MTPPSIYDVFGSAGAGLSAGLSASPKGERDPALIGLGAGLSAFGKREPKQVTPADWLPTVTAAVLVVGVLGVAVFTIALRR